MRRGPGSPEIQLPNRLRAVALHSVLIRADLSPSQPALTGRPLVLAHGFTQNANCWGRFAQLLAERSPVRAVDMAGHGQSGHDDADLPASGQLLVAAGGPGIYIGYSMGGRVALHAALAHPELVEGLVLTGAPAGLDDPADRKKRRAADDEQ